MKDEPRCKREPPTALAWALMASMAELVRQRDLHGAQIDYRRNEKGEHVVAIIFPPQPRPQTVVTALRREDMCSARRRRA